MPEVSVILPTMDRWGLLTRALASVLAQEDVDLEVLVIDDGSSDGTPTRLGAIGDPRLRVLVQESNQGVARARNRGIEEADGEWIAFLDDDDFWAPTCLREHLRSIADAGAGWGYGAAISVGPDRPSRVMMPAPADELEDGLLQHNLVGPPSTVTVRRDLLDEIGGFDERLAVSLNDVDLCLRAIAKGYRNVFTPHAELVHAEGASRGLEVAPAELARAEREAALFVSRWRAWVEADPTYNPNLTLVGKAYALAHPPRHR